MATDQRPPPPSLPLSVETSPTALRPGRSVSLALPADPRPWQILCLASLLALGVFALDFNLKAWHPPAAFAGALATQWLCCRLLRLPFDPLSPAITAFSLSLLLRTDAIWISLLAGVIAIGSKFALRLHNRHVFNPANLALIVATSAFAGAWISPGQWGGDGLWAVAIAGAGAMVAGRAARLDTTLTFLLVWAALLFGRAAYLGDPMAIPLRNIQSGAILVFAFFMISDPATTPRGRAGRMLHASAVAVLGFWLQGAAFWWPDPPAIVAAGPIWALVLIAPLVPAAAWLVDRTRSNPRAKETRPTKHGGDAPGEIER